jgi:hypothetical protein
MFKEAICTIHVWKITRMNLGIKQMKMKRAVNISYLKIFKLFIVIEREAGWLLGMTSGSIGFI